MDQGTDTRPLTRAQFLARLVLLWAVLILARLAYLQIFRHEEFKKLATQQQEKLIEIRAARGVIADRTGTPLAMSVPAESVCVNPLRIHDFSFAATVLSKILDLDVATLTWRIQVAASEGRGFLWIKRKVSAEEATRLRNLKLDWLEFRMESRRVYPHGSLAAHLLGGVDNEEKGNAGIEQALNEELEGHPGAVRMTTDVRGGGYASLVDVEPQPGKPVRLTINSRLQYIAELRLKESVIANHCKSGSLVAMDPNTGDVLAFANYPTYDPNLPPAKGADLTPRINLAVGAPFEPGSVFKVITLAAALETTHLRPETIIPCGNGVLRLAGRVIHDHNSYASLSMEDVLARSSNIGAINIGLKVGKYKLYEYVRNFGFGRSTHVGLPGEEPGLLRPVKKWEESSIGSIAMGHEIGVTSMQLAQACSVIASGGLLVKPRLVSGGEREKPAPRTRVIRPETAITMRNMMEGVVIKPVGTGFKYARIPGYTAAGKTGTAQIYDYKRREYTHFYNASFMGFAPVTNPAIVVVVTVNGATGTAGYGGPAAAPVFRDVAAAALRLLDIPKTLPETFTDTEDVSADTNDLAIAGLGSSVPPPLVQPADTTDDRPAASARVALDQRLFSSAIADTSNQLSGPKVPSFLGMTARDVAEKSAAIGLPIESVGSGLVRAQYPSPGGLLPLGEKVRVQFGR